MKKNVVFMTAINYPEQLDYAEISIATWQRWCRKNNALLYIWDEKIDTATTMRPTWMRYRMFHILEQQGIEYDQVAMVDADTMIRPDCPDFFETSKGSMCAVRDTKRRGWVRKSIRVYQHLFPGVCLNDRNYFNAGFVIVNREHQPLFQDMLDFYNSREAHLRALIRERRMGSDQTPFNFMTAVTGTAIRFLPEEYNVMHFFPFVFNNGLLVSRYPIKRFIDKGFIFHFSGIDKKLVRPLMMRTRDLMNNDDLF